MNTSLYIEGEHESIYRVNEVGLYSLVKFQFLSHGCPTFVRKRAPPFAVGRFAARTWENNNKLYLT